MDVIAQGKATRAQKQTIGRVLDCWGHSYVEGAGVLHIADCFAERLAVLLNTPLLVNHGIAGSPLGASSPGALAYGPSVFARVVLGLPWAGTTPKPYVTQMNAIYSAVNDIGANPIADRGTMLAAFTRAIIAKLRHEIGDQASGASWTFAQGAGGTDWGASTTSGGQTPNSRAHTANGNTWQIALPAASRGGTLRVFVFTNNAGGATHSVTIDGGAPTVYDTRGAGDAVYRPTQLAIPVTAGSHTVIGTIGSRVGSEWMLFWTIDGDDCPPIAYANLNRAPAYPNAATDAQINAINAILNPVAAEFTDGRVVLVDVDTALGYTTANGDQTNFDMVGRGVGTASGGTAGVHPNELGMGVIAREFAKALRPRIPTEAQIAKCRHPGKTFLWTPRFSESAPPTSSQSDPHNKDTCVVGTMVAGTFTWKSRMIDANTRIGGVTPIGDPTGGTAGTVGIVSITASSTTTPGQIVVKSTNASDVRAVHLWIYQADNVTGGINPPSHF